MDVRRIIEVVENTLMWGIVKRMRADSLVKCKYCGGSDVVKFGTYHGSQRWWCKDCKRKFVDADTLQKMKTPIPVIATALSCYYGGMSLDEVARHIEQHHGIDLTDAGVYNWIVRFTRDALRLTKDYIPNVGKVWVADETMIRVGGKHVWYWDIIDAKTRFLLASHISSKRTIKNAQILMMRATARAGNATPDIILTDKLAAYLEGIERTFGADTKHIPIKGITAMLNTNLIERFHGTLKDRTKVMRGFKKAETARIILDGWLVHYNFFRPHESLRDRTPAEYAGIKSPYNDWTDIVGAGRIKVERVVEDEEEPAPKGQLARASPKRRRGTRPKRRTAIKATHTSVSGVRD